MARRVDQGEQINPVFGQCAPICGQSAHRRQRVAQAGADDRCADATGGGENEHGKQSEHGKLPLTGKAGPSRKIRWRGP